MSDISALRSRITSTELADQIKYLYCCGDDQLAAHQARFSELLDRFERFAPDCGDAAFYSAPGRTEIGGNHTDHQHGCVLAAAVTLDALAVAAPNGTSIVRIDSQGYAPFEADLNDLEARPSQSGEVRPGDTVRGIAAYISQLGYEVGGFTACVTSAVPGGSGLSSSACFEVLIGTIFNELFCDNKLTAGDIARAGKHSENIFAGKPSGLLDQMTCAVGGLVSMDFSLEEPVLDSIRYSFENNGYVLCVVNTGGNHSDLTDDYAAITREMRQVAAHYGCEVLRQVDEDVFWAEIGTIKDTLGCRSTLRAAHFFDENNRALEQAQALREDRLELFLQLVNESGRSSESCLQNIYPISAVQEQNLSVALEFAKRSLCGLGAYRVHGGGFAGTIQAYVPVDLYESFTLSMEALFGKNCCHRLAIRPVGGVKFNI